MKIASSTSSTSFLPSQSSDWITCRLKITFLLNFSNLLTIASAKSFSVQLPILNLPLWTRWSLQTVTQLVQNKLNFTSLPRLWTFDQRCRPFQRIRASAWKRKHRFRLVEQFHRTIEIWSWTPSCTVSLYKSMFNILLQLASLSPQLPQLVKLVQSDYFWWTMVVKRSLLFVATFSRQFKSIQNWVNSLRCVTLYTKLLKCRLNHSVVNKPYFARQQ